ncbi:MAG: hypothetical protein FJ253_05335 [Phycisphaerae bacterium]|nr:hypothetical protein [Phycisphaerae bacterium]
MFPTRTPPNSRSPHGGPLSAGPFRAVAVILVVLGAICSPAFAQTHFFGWTYVSAEADAPQFNEIRIQMSEPVSGVAIVPGFISVESGATILQTSSTHFTVRFNEALQPGATFSLEFTAGGPEPEFVAADLVFGNTLVAKIGLDGLIRNLTQKVVGEVVKAVRAWIAPMLTEWSIILRIHQWGFSLIGGDENAMAGYYANDATLLPTLGIYALYRNKALKVGKHDEPIIRNYFRYKFLPKMPLMMPLNLGTVHVAVSGDGNTASANGLYTFVLLAPGGCYSIGWPHVVNARFTFVFKRAAAGMPWLILQHHSSQNPSDKNLKPAKRACLGDMNHDGKVDGEDLGELLGAWGGNSFCPDINDDGVVDGDDLGELLGSWGACP